MKLIELQQKMGERMTALCDGSTSNEDLVREIERSKATASLAKEMVRNADTILKAKRLTGTLSEELVNSLV